MTFRHAHRIGQFSLPQKILCRRVFEDEAHPSSRNDTLTLRR
jgi:hypothetical protein